MKMRQQNLPSRFVRNFKGMSVSARMSGNEILVLRCFPGLGDRIESPDHDRGESLWATITTG